MFQIEDQLLRIATGGKLTRRLFTQRGRGVQFGTSENKSRLGQGGGFEPETSRLKIQHPKPLGHFASTASAKELVKLKGG